MNSKISSTKVTKEVPVLVRNEDIDIGTSYLPYLNNLQISERHKNFTTYDLSELWEISLDQDTITIKKTMQKLLCSDVILLTWRYHTGRVFTRNTLQGKW